MAWALDGLAAAVMLLCHISQGGLIITHIISGVLVRIYRFSELYCVSEKAGTSTYQEIFFWSTLQIKLNLV